MSNNLTYKSRRVRIQVYSITRCTADRQPPNVAIWNGEEWNLRDRSTFRYIECTPDHPRCHQARRVIRRTFYVPILRWSIVVEALRFCPRPPFLSTLPLAPFTISLLWMCETWALESKVKGTLLCTLEAGGERELLKRQSAAFKAWRNRTLYTIWENDGRNWAGSERRRVFSNAELQYHVRQGSWAFLFRCFSLVWKLILVGSDGLMVCLNARDRVGKQEKSKDDRASPRFWPGVLYILRRVARDGTVR